MMSTITVAELLQDKARQAAASALFSVAPDVSIADAVNVMVTKRISSILVSENENMLGSLRCANCCKASIRTAAT